MLRRNISELTSEGQSQDTEPDTSVIIKELWLLQLREFSCSSIGQKYFVTYETPDKNLI